MLCLHQFFYCSENIYVVLSIFSSVNVQTAYKYSQIKWNYIFYTSYIQLMVFYDSKFISLFSYWYHLQKVLLPQILKCLQDPALGMTSSPKRMSLSTLGARVHTGRTTVERQTQTENRVPRWKQLFYCLGQSLQRMKSHKIKHVLIWLGIS